MEGGKKGSWESNGGNLGLRKTKKNNGFNGVPLSVMQVTPLLPMAGPHPTQGQSQRHRVSRSSHLHHVLYIHMYVSFSQLMSSFAQLLPSTPIEKPRCPVKPTCLSATSPSLGLSRLGRQASCAISKESPFG